MDSITLVKILNQIKMLPYDLRNGKAVETLLDYINNADVTKAYQELNQGE